VKEPTRDYFYLEYLQEGEEKSAEKKRGRAQTWARERKGRDFYRKNKCAKVEGC